MAKVASRQFAAPRPPAIIKLIRSKMDLVPACITDFQRILHAETDKDNCSSLVSGAKQNPKGLQQQQQAQRCWMYLENKQKTSCRSLPASHLGFRNEEKAGEQQSWHSDPTSMASGPLLSLKQNSRRNSALLAGYFFSGEAVLPSPPFQAPSCWYGVLCQDT